MTRGNGDKGAGPPDLAGMRGTGESRNHLRNELGRARLVPGGVKVRAGSKAVNNVAMGHRVPINHASLSLGSRRLGVAK
jgi:hypothetical protein